MSVKLESTHVSALNAAEESRRAAIPPRRRAATSSAGHPSRTLSIAASGTALVMAVFSGFVVNVGDSVRTFHAGVAGEAWGLSGMSLGLAAALLTAGAFADDLGHRRVLRCSAGLLAAASAAGALAPSMEILVAARVLQGVAGGGLLAAGLGSIGRTFPSGRARTHATAVWGAAVGAGVTVGPLAGAGLAAAVGWRTGFWLEAAAARVCLEIPNEGGASMTSPCGYVPAWSMIRLQATAVSWVSTSFVVLFA